MFDPVGGDAFDYALNDDRLDVGMRCARIGNSSIQFLGGVFRGDDLLVDGELIYVFADPHSQTSRPVPASRPVRQSRSAAPPSARAWVPGFRASNS